MFIRWCTFLFGGDGVSVYSNDRDYVFSVDGLFSGHANSSGAAGDFVKELNRLNDEIKSMHEVVNAAVAVTNNGGMSDGRYAIGPMFIEALSKALCKYMQPKTQAELENDIIQAAILWDRVASEHNKKTLHFAVVEWLKAKGDL